MLSPNVRAWTQEEVDSWIESRPVLIEGLHITGYTFERAYSNLESLLDGERWRLDGRFSDPNEFLDSLRLDKFRAVAEQRKRIAQRIKELQPRVSNRQIARTLGVDEGTIRNDVAAESSAPAEEKTNEVAMHSASSGRSAPDVASRHRGVSQH
jgi:hypothetical protein